MDEENGEESDICRPDHLRGLCGYRGRRRHNIPLASGQSIHGPMKSVMIPGSSAKVRSSLAAIFVLESGSLALPKRPIIITVCAGMTSFCTVVYEAGDD